MIEVVKKKDKERELKKIFTMYFLFLLRKIDEKKWTVLRDQKQ